MPILEALLRVTVLLVLAGLIVSQLLTQKREYRFYKANNWDFSVDSGMDKIDQRITTFDLGLSNRQRLFLFRPFYIAVLTGVWILMVASAI